jgi:hypothetical protein
MVAVTVSQQPGLRPGLFQFGAPVIRALDPANVPATGGRSGDDQGMTREQGRSEWVR